MCVCRSLEDDEWRSSLCCHSPGPLEKYERRSVVKKKLHFTFHLPSQSGIFGVSRELMWGETPIHVFPQLTKLLTRRLESISIHGPIVTLFCNYHESQKWWWLSLHGGNGGASQQTTFFTLSPHIVWAMSDRSLGDWSMPLKVSHRERTPLNSFAGLCADRLPLHLIFLISFE